MTARIDALPISREAVLSRFIGRLPRYRWLDAVVVVLVVILLLMAVFGPLIVPYDPYRSDPVHRLLPASAEHWLGTDSEGRDILSRLLAGAQPTLVASLVIVVASTAIGVVIATLAAVGPRWLDELLMRVCDIVLSMPGLLLALAIAAALGAGWGSAVLALVISLSPSDARLARGVIHRTMTAPFVEAARALGVSTPRLVLRHVLPNSLDEVLVNSTANIGGVTLIMAGLSFIGVGAQPPSAEWGAMASLAAPYLTTSWPAAVIPGALITVSAVAFALLGDIVRVRLNPNLTR